MNDELRQIATALPEQKAFFKIPARFGHVPVAEEPLGYDHERRFEQHYPRIELPFQFPPASSQRNAGYWLAGRLVIA